MQNQDTGHASETMRHVGDTLQPDIDDLILNGYSVNTGLLPSRCATDRRDRGRRMEQGEELHLRLPYAGQGVARGDRQTAVEILGEKSQYHVHPRDRG